MPDSTAKILLVSSSGGVLLDLLALESWWSRYTVVWAVVPATDTRTALGGQRVRWVAETSIRQPLSLFPSFVRAWRLLRSERPNLIVSAGSGPAIPFFILAKFRGTPTFWLSTFNILATPGISARVCARLASRVLLQQASLRQAHPEGVIIGELY